MAQLARMNVGYSLKSARGFFQREGDTGHTFVPLQLTEQTQYMRHFQGIGLTLKALREQANKQTVLVLHINDPKLSWILTASRLAAGDTREAKTNRALRQMFSAWHHVEFVDVTRMPKDAKPVIVQAQPPAAKPAPEPQPEPQVQVCTIKHKTGQAAARCKRGVHPAAF